MSSLYLISNSIFEQISSSGNGGIFSLEEGKLFFQCSSFNLNTASQSGGCIYFTGTSIELKKASFFKCASLAHSDGIKGNVLASTGGDGIIENINTELCGYSDNDSSDSCISFYSSKSIISFVNATRNYGYGGGSCCSCLISTEGTELSFLNIVEGRDSYNIEAFTNHYAVTKTNFIDCTHCKKNSVAYANQNYLFTFISCVFKQMGNTKIVVNNLKYYAENCQTDGSFESIQQISNPSTILFEIEVRCNIHSQVAIMKSKLIDNIQIKFLFVLFISSS